MNAQEKFLHTITAQLECELALGGLWLPVGNINIDIKSKTQTQARVISAGTDNGRDRRVSTENAQPAVKDYNSKMASTKDNQNKSGVQQRVQRPQPRQVEPQQTRQAQQQLDTIAMQVAKCYKCQLHKTRINTVPGQGNPQARIVFVGEAPGQNEDEQGLPFVGRAGKLLDNIIKAMGLTRQDVFIGNILKCRPPDNRDPRPDEIVACIGYLHQQLEIIDPDVIIALGAHAARTLLDTNRPIGQLRGQVHEYQPGLAARPVKLVATYHPAYLLRNYTRDCRLKVWQDMQLALKQLI